MLKKIRAVKRAMSVGEMLENPIPWKNAQSMTGLILAALGAGMMLIDAFFGYSLNFSEAELGELSTMLSTLAVTGYGLFNWITTNVTSDKVGVPGKRDD
jgi:Ca2+/H+ antiporter